MLNYINEINDSDIFVRIFEVGAGVPIANEFYNYAGASKSVYSVESYYSRYSYEKMFGYSTSRAVSAEKLKDINDNLDIQKDINNNIYNTVLSTTFQVGDVNNKISTHGWISLNINNKIRYYHISLHLPNERKEYIKIIGEIGIRLLHSKNENIPNDCFVDIVLDENLNPLYNDTLEFLSNCCDNDMMSVFTKDGCIDRLEFITRDIENLIVYKGSFNPPTLSHKEIIEKTSNCYDNKKVVFCLSYNTFQKGKQSTESFMDRINFLNKMGWDVLVTSKPLFKDTYDFIRLKFDGKIIFPQGVDTLNRMCMDYIHQIGMDKSTTYFHIKGFLNDFKNTDFVVFHRNGENIDNTIQKELIDTELVKIVIGEHKSEISSTMIREFVNNGRYDEIKELVPIEIYEDVINKTYK